jgi:hypothetical protein
MLGFWRNHNDYQSFLANELSIFASSGILHEYEDLVHKLCLLDLDLLKPIIAPLYGTTGRSARYQPEIFRTFVIMSRLKTPIDKWEVKLRLNPVIRILAGFPNDYAPSKASFYDFINRIYKLDERPRAKFKKRKPKKKYGKGEKMPPKHPNVVARLVERILSGRRFDSRPELVLQTIFARTCVDTSRKLGLLGDVITMSGDGTCMHTGASPAGRKTCQCSASGNYHCDCSRKFSDPNASWGWDSHNERYIYGYTGYFLSSYDKQTNTDLPIYIRLVDAKRHDSVSAVVAIAEFRDMHPDIVINDFLSDSASDNHATYELLEAWNINAIIALNGKRGRKSTLPSIELNDDGVPICPAGHPMIYWGTFTEKSRPRNKWRCPRVLQKTEACEACSSCSDSSYGRVVYTKPKWDIRIFTKIPRGTAEWKLKMNERTAAERVNNRILNHFGMEHTRQRGKKRISFFTTIAAINIHLDAQLAKLKSEGTLDFEGAVGMRPAI